MTKGAADTLQRSWRPIILVGVGLLCGIAIGRFSPTGSAGAAGRDRDIQGHESGHKWAPAMPDAPAGRQASGQGNSALELRRALEDPDPVSATQRFASILQTITASELPDAARSLWAKPGNSHEMNERKRLLGYRWGQLAGSAAVEFAQGQTGQGKVTAISAALAGWASVDPNTAKNWIDGQVDPRIRHLYNIALRSIH